MAKSDSDASRAATTTNKTIDNQLQSSNNFTNDYNTELLNAAHDSYNTGTTERSNISTGYNNMLSNGGVSDEEAARMRNLYTSLSSAANSGGGYTAPSYTYSKNIGGVEDYYKTLMGGGGVNRYALSDLQDLAAADGGWSDENKAAMTKALAGYSNYADTGGYTDQAKSDYMNEATGVIPAMYTAANNEARRNANIQGGNPGLSYALRNNLRSQASAAQDATRSARLGLNDQINTNKMAGLSGLGTTSTGYQNSINDTRLNATGQLNDLTATDLSAANTGASGLNSIISNKANESASQASAANAASRASYADKLAAAKLGLTVEQYLTDTANANKLSSLSGMTNLYGTADANYQANVDNVLANQSLGQNTASNLINSRVGNNSNLNQNSGWDTFNNVLGTAGSIASGITGGLSGALSAVDPNSNSVKTNGNWAGSNSNSGLMNSQLLNGIFG